MNPSPMFLEKTAEGWRQTGPAPEDAAIRLLNDKSVLLRHALQTAWEETALPACAAHTLRTLTSDHKAREKKAVIQELSAERLRVKKNRDAGRAEYDASQKTTGADAPIRDTLFLVMNEVARNCGQNATKKGAEKMAADASLSKIEIQLNAEDINISAIARTAEILKTVDLANPRERTMLRHEPLRCDRAMLKLLNAIFSGMANG